MTEKLLRETAGVLPRARSLNIVLLWEKAGGTSCGSVRFWLGLPEKSSRGFLQTESRHRCASLADAGRTSFLSSVNHSLASSATLLTRQHKRSGHKEHGGGGHASHDSSPADCMGTSNGWSLAVDTHPLSLQYVKTSCVDATESCNEHVLETLSVNASRMQPAPCKRQFLQ